MKPAPFIGCLALFAAAAALCFIADGYQLFVIATVGLRSEEHTSELQSH